MHIRRFLIILLFIITGVFLSLAQWKPDAAFKETAKKNMYATIAVLSADSLEGREAGTKGDTMAMRYIESRFREIGLQPVFETNVFAKPFQYTTTDNYSKYSALHIGKSSFYFNTSFSILSYPGRVSINAYPVFAGNGLVITEKTIDDYAHLKGQNLKEKIIVIDISFPEKYDFITTGNYYEQLQEVIHVAVQKEPQAIILYQSDSNRFTFHRNTIFQNPRSYIPILFAEKDLANAILLSPNEEILIRLDTYPIKETSFNIAGMVDNKAPTTIVIGAHYDHLGYGSPISRHSGPPAIHYGADDNASGVAMMLELARFVKNNKFTTHNYIFVAFGAEEKGLLGSKAFIEDDRIANKNIIAMFNLDMVGRLDVETGKLNIIGTGSSVVWDSLLTLVSQPKVEISKNPSVGGGSDHVAFYLKKIPVLFFITGMHKDYHTPNDVIKKINLEGMVDIATLLINLLFHLENVRKIPYQQADITGQQGRGSRTGGVSLGIVPDHAYGGKGLRVDDVTTGKPADLAGVKAGDIITAIDASEISDISSYMKALSGYQPGSKATLTVLRKNTVIKLEVIF